MVISLRVKCNDLKDLEEKINSLKGLKILSEPERQVDTYIKHPTDLERCLVIRIRRKEDGAVLSFKSKSGQQGDTWYDVNLPLSKPEVLEDILMNSGYVYVTLVDKVRQSFSYQEFLLNIDKVRDLGLYVEIAKSYKNNNREQTKLELKRLLFDLGFSNEEIIENGYVSLMIKKENETSTA